MVVVHAASMSDSAGARVLLSRIVGLFPRLVLIWADGTYQGTLIDWALELGEWTIEIMAKDATRPGFQVVPHRWVVERTFAWFGRYRRLSKDYEYLPESSEAMIYLAMIRLMLARLARTTRPQHFAAPMK